MSPRPLHLTFGLMLFCYSSITGSRVILSLYALSLGAPASAVGMLFAAMYAFPLVLSWPVGVMSDRFGARGPLILAAMIAAAGMLIPYFMRELAALYLACVLLGLTISVYNVSLQSIVGLLSQPHDRTRNFANASLIGSINAFAGPLLAGFAIDQFGHATACLYIVALSLAALTLLLLWGNVLPGGNRRNVRWQDMQSMLRNRGILQVLGLSSLVQSGQDLFQFYIPIYGYRLGLSASAIGSVLAAFAAAEFIMRFIMPRLIARLGEERLLVYSFALGAAGFALVPACQSAIALAAVTFMFGFSTGCGHPVTTILMFSRSPEGRSGESFGLRQTVTNLTRVSCPALFGYIVTAVGLTPVFWINAALMGLGSWMANVAAKRNSG